MKYNIYYADTHDLFEECDSMQEAVKLIKQECERSEFQPEEFYIQVEKEESDDIFESKEEAVGLELCDAIEQGDFN